MSNPFAQDAWDPFGELPASKPPPQQQQQQQQQQQRQQQQSAGIGLKPARLAPPPPRPALVATANPFGQLPSAYSGSSSNNSSSSSSKQKTAPAEDYPFGLLGAAIETGSSSVLSGTAPQAAAPPSYDDIFGAAAAAAAPPSAADAALPSYEDALGLPPPPAYEVAAVLPPAPPSYESLMRTHQQPPTVSSPARVAPQAPALQGPLHAGIPASRQSPARPAPAAPGAAAPAAAAVPARAAPAAPGAAGAPVPARAAPPAPQPRVAPAAPAAAAAAEPGAAGYSAAADDTDWLGSVGAPAQQLQQQLAAVHMSGGSLSSSASSSSSLNSSYFSTGNIGAVPRAGIYNSQQAQQRELNAQIRLSPLNPKTAAPLKTLAAGLGCLFAGPVDEGGQIMQWSPNESGTTLPPGAQRCPREDHDSGACAELVPSPSEPAKGRVSSMLLAPAPGVLWCGGCDGAVHCWALCRDGTGTAARWLHSWQAHGGKKVKALALSPSGRLFTGTGTGVIRMWSYGGPAAFGDAAPPRLLRQLCKLDPRSGVQLPPHSKVIELAVSASGRVLWSAGKSTISLWSTHNGECLGTISSEGSELQQQQQSMQQQHGGYAAMGGGPAPADINPRTGLDAARLAAQFERPSAELLAADDEAVDAEKDTAAILINTGVKAMGKASKLLNKLGNRLQEKASKMLDDSRGGSAEVRYDGSASATSAYSSSSSAATDSNVPGAYGSGGMAAAAAAAAKSADALNKGDIKRVIAAADGSVWVGYKRGVLERYSEAGQLLWSSATSAPAASASVFRPADITAVAAACSSIWVGDAHGQLWVLDASTAALQRSWKAHVFPVRSIAAGGHLVYSLGKDGSICAWPALPPPAALTAAWQQDVVSCMKEQQLTVLVGTWNVNEMKPSRAGLQAWLAERTQHAQLVMVGLQEVEMGTMSVGKDAITQYLAKPKAESVTAAAQAWVSMVGDVLRSAGDFRKVSLRQMSGMLVMVFVRAELEPHIGEVATASVACGVLGYGGNKGAVAVTFSLFRRRVVVVSSHFAAHQDKVEARNADYAKIVRHLHFHNVPTDNPQQQQQYEASNVLVLGGDLYTELSSSSASSGRRLAGGSPGISPRKAPVGRTAGDAGSGGGGMAAAAGDDDEWGAGMRDAELLVWVGDFNYRVDRPDGFQPDDSDPENNPVNTQLCQYVHRKISAKQHLDLLSGDQCIREMAKGAIFHGLAEGPIRFLPTYKFEKGRESNALQPFYDQGEKKRVPAWTDRVLFRGSGAQRSALECNAADQRSGVRVCLASPQAYNSLMEVNVSDHKPVYAVLAVHLLWYQQQQLRRCSLGRLWQAAAAAAGGSFNSTSSYADAASGGSLSLLLHLQQLTLQGSNVPAALQLRNPSHTCSCIFAVQSTAIGGALPTWLEVVPAAGVLAPGGCLTVRVQGTKAAQWQATGGLRCELCVLGCIEGSVDSSRWPVACYQDAPLIPVVLP